VRVVLVAGPGPAETPAAYIAALAEGASAGSTSLVMLEGVVDAAAYGPVEPDTETRQKAERAWLAAVSPREADIDPATRGRLGR
jgi:hypothetical protein